MIVCQFPEYPPPGAYDQNETLASATGILPYGIGYADPALANTSVHYDLGYYGPQIELVHAYYNYWPTVRTSLTLRPKVLVTIVDGLGRVSVWPAMA